MVDLPHPPLRRADLADDPIEQFDRWYEAWRREPRANPEAMVVSTVGAGGQPSARYVLLRGHDARGFEFFTNYRSRKGRELAANPRVALTFGWIDHDRQVRVTGRCEPLPAAESDQYWDTRLRGSQLAASISDQSEPVADRAALQARYDALEAKFDGRPVARPDHWGGYRVVPAEIEFWQGQPFRLHDRFVYRRASPGDPWVVERLMP
ncbi:MAG TPA: pyridoxamine 5'-phosphate oxidase [Acidimicrobiales bacterium]|nr:pyridoxamine 5'-phosphate oxidase [Acidimicrobiales bacterium]